MNSIIWKGVPSTTIKGLLISELPPISRPAMRVKETTIDGRDGSIIEDLGYSSYDKNVVIGLHGNFDINKVIKYFTGEGEVVFSNEPDKVYSAKIVGQIDYNRLLRNRQATIPFRVQPFKHKLNEAYKPAQTVAVSGASINVDAGENAKIKTFSIYGKTTQNGTPTPNAPKELVSVGGGGSIAVSVTGGGGANAQSVAVQTPNGLRGIPVPSGGNYTDASGQQWICDELDFVKGVYIQRVGQKKIEADSELIRQSPDHTVTLSVYIPCTEWGVSKKYYQTTLLCTIAIPGAAGSTNDTKPNVCRFNATFSNFLLDVSLAEYPSLEVLRRYLTEHPFHVYYLLGTPVETMLTEEELAAYASLLTYKDNTTVFNDASAHMKVEWFEPYEVFNEGLETSKPIMVLKGEGTVVISVNGLEIFQYTFPEGENEVVIDSEKEDAYLGDVLKNRNMNGEFPVLLPGTNIIEWSGYVSSIEILPRSRWL